ncbi:hypothetical protein COY52_08035, partial [Candidatus Desantisbacteria bacterium CG_4_10_14_0_8_um_filter_48_22]
MEIRKYPFFLFVLLIVISISLLCSLYVFAKDGILWTRTYDGGDYDEAYGATTDAQGNVYVAGCSSNIIDGDFDATVIKYSPDGNVEWVRKYDPDGGQGLFFNEAWAVTTDISGNVIAAGYYGDGIDYTSGYLTLKYSPDGGLLWARKYYSEEAYEAYGVTTDAQGNVIATGEAGVGFLTIKYGSNGSFLWSTISDYGTSEEGHAVATDGSNNIIVTGRSRIPDHWADFFTIKYDPNGNEMWTKRYDGGSDRLDEGNGVGIDGSDNIIVTGRSYPYDYLTIKYNSDGELSWIQRYDSGGQDTARGVDIDSKDNIVVTGWIGNMSDVLTIKYASDSTVLSIRKYDSGAGYEYATGVAVDDTGNISISGYSPLNGGDFLTIKYSSEIEVKVTASPKIVKAGKTSRITVKVTDYFNEPFSDMKVRFKVIAGNGSVYPETTETNGKAEAYAVLTTDTATNTNTVEVSVDIFSTTVNVLGLATPNENLLGKNNNKIQKQGGDPVSTYSGNLIASVQDLYLPGRGIPIQFIRTYNSLSANTSALGYKWTYSYNIYLAEEGADTDVLYFDGDGGIYRYTKNGGSYTSPKGIYSTLTKNPDLTYTLKEKDGTEYYFDSQGKLTTIQDRNNNQVVLSYTGNLLTSITDSVNRAISFSYVNNKLSSMADPFGRVTSYTYNDSEYLIQVSAPGYTATYNYDTQHNLISKVDPRAPKGYTRNSFVYDKFGRAVEGIDGLDNPQLKLNYDINTLRTSVMDAKGNQAFHQYSSDGFLTEDIDAKGNITFSIWDTAKLNKTSVTDGNDHTTSYEYDDRGNCTKITDHLNNITTFEYEPTFNNLTKMTDALNHQTIYEYNAKGNLLKVTDTIGGITSYTYDEYGQRLSMTDPRGKTTTFSYDQYGNLASVTDPLGN